MKTDRKIIGIGESILDIVFKDNQPVKATPGGSVFNGLITLGRLGLNVEFVSDVGRDRVGALICEFMRSNGVSDRSVNRHPSARTAVSLAFLDENSDADYTFFKDYSYEGLQGEFPEIRKDDIVVFGSYYALNPLLRPRMKCFLESARKAGALMYYDVNFRKSHSYEAGYLEPVLRENYAFADILRGSEDDFRALYECDDVHRIYEERIHPYTDIFVYTAGPKAVTLKRPDGDLSYRVPEITPLSTVGAGDNFNAGIVYGLYHEGIGRDDLAHLDKERWKRVLSYAQAFSSAVCQSYENYISPEMAEKYRNEQNNTYNEII